MVNHKNQAPYIITLMETIEEIQLEHCSRAQLVVLAETFESCIEQVNQQLQKQ